MEEVKVALDSETTQFIVVKLGDEQIGRASCRERVFRAV